MLIMAEVGQAREKRPVKAMKKAKLFQP